jgi:hypothetical protein
MMQHLWRRGVVFAVTSLLVMGLLSISGAATGAAKGVTAKVLKHLPPGPGPVVGTCKLVPARVAASDLGVAVFVNGPGNHSQRLSVKGKTLNLNWTDCNYDHVPGDLAAMHFTLSFVFESSNAEASSILHASCASLRTIATTYSTPAIGNGACAQGHGGGQQVGQGFMAVDTVVISIFGNQSPPQTVTLLKSIAPFLTAANVKKVIGTGSAPGGPGVLFASHAYSVTNGSIAVALKCIRAKCSGDAEMKNGAVVLAKAPYVVPKGKTRTVNLALTTSGQSAFSNAAVTPVQVTLQVTVFGGQTTSRMALVS